MMLSLRKVSAAFALVSLAACGGCGPKKDDAEKGDAPKKDAAAKTDKTETGAAPAKGGAYDAAKGTATLKGVVKFKGTPPAQTPHDMGSEKTCAAHGTVIVEKTQVNADGTLPHAWVSVVSGPSIGMSGYTAPKVVVDQKGCTYTPHVFGALAGQPVSFRNSDNVTHNVHVKPKKQSDWNKSQSAGQVDDKAFDKESAVRIGCDIHGWMSAYMFVMDHPFGAASAQGTGAYEIKGLYPGKHKIRVWHENFAKDKPVEMEIELKDGENVQDFEIAGG
jgi:plastocyanin